MVKKTLVVSFYGGPGVGKSTVAASVFASLKTSGINAELVTEYAKTLTWNESWKTLKNQIYVFAKQHHRMWSIKDSVEVIVTDAPLLNSILYGERGALDALIIEEYEKFENINILLERKIEYEKSGRYQDEDTAKKIDTEALEMLKRCNVPYFTYTFSQEDREKIVSHVKERVYELRKDN